MKKLKLFFACLLMAVLSIGQVWGGETTYTMKTSGSGTAVEDNWTANTSATFNSSGAYWSCSAATNTFTITSGSGITGTITKVQVTGKRNKAKSYTIDVTVGGSALGSQFEGTGSTTASSSTYDTEDTFSSSTGLTGTIVVSVSAAGGTSSSDKGSFWITSVTVTTEDGGGEEPTQVATPSFSLAEGSYEGTQSVTITCATEGATIYYTTDGGTPSSSSTEYEDAISVSATQTIKAIAIKDGLDNSEVAEATYTITEGPDVTLDLLDGKWGFPTDNTTELTTYTNSVTGYAVKCFAATAYKVSGTSYFIIGKSGSYIELPTFASPVEKIIVTKGGGSSPSGSVVFNIFDGDDAVSTAVTGCGSDQTFEIENPEAGKTYTLKVTSAHNLQIAKIKIYFGAAPAVAKPTISGETPFLNTTEVSISIPDGATVYYTTDGSTPSSASEQYSAPFVLNNSATVKAIAVKGEDISAVAEKAFEKATVMTVAQARAAIDNGGDLTNKFVAGIVSQIDSYNSTYNSLTYWISDDGTTTNQLEVFSGLAGVVKTAFASTDDIHVGDDVTVKGTLKKFSSTYEFDKNNEIVAYKPIALLAWSAESYDAELGGSNSFPTLTNTNNVAITYSSSDENVATIAANGDITLVATGTTTITAAFAGNETYKANSASYELTVAAAVIRADISFNVDGGSAVEALTDQSALPNPLPTTTKAGMNFGGWYTDAGKTVAAVAGAAVESTDAITLYAKWLEPYTVAQALTMIDALADGGETENSVYVSGIVSTEPTANPSSGKLTFYISANGEAEDELQAFNCKGLNNENFTAKTDIQALDEVVIYGPLKKYMKSNVAVPEFNGCYLYSFSRPEVPVTSVELAATATVKVGKTINLSASVLPANATNQGITWSVESGSDKITFDNGSVTGVAEGEAVIRATSAADNTKHAECTVTIAAADPTYAYYFYGKVTETAGIEDGQYLIVYEDESVAFNGGLKTLDAAHNTIAVEIEDGLIVSNATTDAASFTIGVTAGTIQAAMGDYIGVTSYANGLKQNADAATYPAHSFSIDEEENAIVSLNDGWSGTMILNYNTGASDKRFRYYKDGSQKKIQLYKRFGTDVAPKANPQLAWDPADDIEITVGDEFTSPALTYVEGFDGVAAVVIESDNTDLAIVTAGVVSLVADATGEANITATFAGNDNYKAATASYKITVNAAATPAVSGNIVILAEFGGKYYAMTNTLDNGALAGVEVEKDGSKIVVSSAEDKAAIQWTATVDGDNTTLKDADDYYITGSSGASLSLEADPYNWNWDGKKSCYISSAYTNRGLFFNSANNVFKGYALSNITGDGYAATEVIEIDPENIVISSKVDPELAYTPASDEITVGDAWSAPVLGYVEGFDGLAAITYESSNEAVATVSDAGVIALAGGTGTATITATFGGNANYLAGSATYTVKVNEPAEDCDGSDDFSTATNTSASSYNVERTTTNGWSSVYSALTTINSEARWLTMLGKTSQVGVITSPTLNDGIASLKIRYANTFNETNGVSFRVDIKQGEDIVKTYTITKENSEVEKGTVYTEIIENINVAGDFQMIFTNLCPSNADSNKDRVSIGRLCWTGYSAPTPVYETVRPGLTAGNYYTICYNKTMTEIHGASLWSFAGKDASMAYLVEAKKPYAAGTPYFIYAESDKLEAVVEEVTNPVAGNANGLYGTFDDLSNADLLDKGATYMLYQNALHPIGAGHLDAFRAYVILDEIPDATEAEVQQSAPGRRVRQMPLQENTATGLGELNASEAPVKMVINGQLYIMYNGTMYNVQGQLVR